MIKDSCTWHENPMFFRRIYFTNEPTGQARVLPPAAATRNSLCGRPENQRLKIVRTNHAMQCDRNASCPVQVAPTRVFIALLCHMQIDLGRLQRRVAEMLLQHFQIDAVVEQMNCIAVSLLVQNLLVRCGSGRVTSPISMRRRRAAQHGFYAGYLDAACILIANRCLRWGKLIGGLCMARKTKIQHFPSGDNAGCLLHAFAHWDCMMSLPETGEPDWVAW